MRPTPRLRLEQRLRLGRQWSTDIDLIMPTKNYKHHQQEPDRSITFMAQIHRKEA